MLNPSELTKLVSSNLEGVAANLREKGFPVSVPSVGAAPPVNEFLGGLAEGVRSQVSRN